MTKLAAGVSLVVLVALLGACSGGDSKPKPVYPATINIHGDVTLSGPANVRGNISDCAGAGRYADLVTKAPVTVSNKSGVPLAVGTILYSVGTNVYRNQLDQCTFRYVAYNVPRAPAYQIVIARQAPISAEFVTLFRAGGIASLDLPPTTLPTTTTLPQPTTHPSG